MNISVDLPVDDLSVCEKSSLVVDLSQQNQRLNSTEKQNFVENWTEQSQSTKIIFDQFEQIPPQSIENSVSFDINRPLTSQVEICSIDDETTSDKIHFDQSQIDFRSRKTPKKSTKIFIEELKPTEDFWSENSSSFLWTKYFSLIDERPIGEEFFDHYLSSVRPGLEIDMKIEYCYDTQQDLYWLAQIKLISHRLILLHYLGLPESETSFDFWADLYGKLCRPIGWCKENSKLMIPPSIVKKRVIQQTSTNNSNSFTNFNEKQSNNKNEAEELPTPAKFIFDKAVGLTSIEQLKIGMIVELQEIERPWTLWFVRIVENRGGRLKLKYILDLDDKIEQNSTEKVDFIHLFYLDWHIHPLGWTWKHSPKYTYEIPKGRKILIDKDHLINFCLSHEEKQFLPADLFNEQEKIVEHRFTEGMKLEVFDSKTLNIYLGEITQVHNEFYFNVQLDDENRSSFIGHGNHPFILPAHWAVEHRLVLMKGKSIRQSEDYWTQYTEEHGIADVAPESCFRLITLNSNGSSRVEPGMKLEMISTIDGDDRVFSVTLITVVDHLMWLRIDNKLSINGEQSLYRVLPINSLDLFPVGWAKYSGFELITPIEYKVEINSYQQDRFHLFSSVSAHPKIPRVYCFDKCYELTLFVNIRCFSGPHLCSSRLARIPSKIGPGPFRLVLIDLFHNLLSALSTNAHRTLRRLEHHPNIDSSMKNLKIEYIKVAKKSGKFIRPIALPTDPRLINHFLRHACTQLESCPNLVTMKQIETVCSDQCYRLNNSFASSVHSKSKRTGAAQLRAAQQRQKRRKSLLSHFKTDVQSSTTINEEIPSIESPSEGTTTIESSSSTSNETNPVLPPGSDRKTRGFRVHIEPRTHTVTRTNRKQKLLSTMTIKQEPIDSSQIETTNHCDSTVNHQDSLKTRRNRSSKKRHSPSPVRSPSMTLNILSPTTTSSLTSNSKTTKKKRRSSPSVNTFPSPSEESNLIQENSSLIVPPLSIPPSTNPVTWNVSDVCWYLNQSGCSFALKTIQEQEIDGAALLLLDDLPTVQDLLEFKLGPAVKFCHVVEQLRSQVIETIHSSPSLKPKRLSSNVS